MQFKSFDDLYETSEQFDSLYRQMADILLDEAVSQAHLIYAVPGHPLVAEQSVQHLLNANRPGVEVEIGPGQSFLDVAAARLAFDPIEGLLLLDGTTLLSRQLNPTVHTLIAQVYQPSIAADVKLTLMEAYPDDYPVTVLRAAGVKGEERIMQIALYELDRLDFIDHLTTLYLAPSTREDVRQRDLWEAVDVVSTLRSPDGCPWDKEQTHESLRRYVIEEAYEVAEAIDEGDTQHLCEELGDLLLQILLHARIAEEFGDFSIRDVFAGLTEKLIRRHPHVFGSRVASTPEDVAAIWADVKAMEQTDEAKKKSQESILARVSLAGPALMVATDVQKAAAKVGFDWQQIKDVLEKAKEEMNEVEQELLRTDGESNVEEELGDLLFACVNITRFLKLDAESILVNATKKFMDRFQFVEDRVVDSGRNWLDVSPESLNMLWEEAKIARMNKN